MGPSIHRGRQHKKIWVGNVSYLDDSNLVGHIQRIEIGGQSNIGLLGVQRGDQCVHLNIFIIIIYVFV